MPSPLLETVSAISNFITALVAILALILTIRAGAIQLLESVARMDLALNVNVTTRIFAVTGTNSVSEQTRILETRIEITNVSRRTLCIPMVYVSARALVKRGLQESYLGESDFDNLLSCGKLSEVRNVGRIENSIIQLAPDETERFVRWDTLESKFVNEFPVVVVNVEVISASAELLGEKHFPKFKQGKLRREWLEFMDSNDGIRHRSIMIARWKSQSKLTRVKKLFWRLGIKTKEYPFHFGERYLRAVDDLNKADVDASITFDDVLKTIVIWSRHITVDLSAVA